jgi:hypothetical protein
MVGVGIRVSGKERGTSNHVGKALHDCQFPYKVFLFIEHKGVFGIINYEL